MKIPGIARFWIAVFWLFGSAVLAAYELIAGHHLMLFIMTLATGGIGAAMLAEWWCEYYD